VRHARHDMCDSHDTYSGAWTGVDMSISFYKVVPDADVNPEHKRLNLYTREHYCFLVVRHFGTSTADTLVKTRSTRRTCHVEK